MKDRRHSPLILPLRCWVPHPDLQTLEQVMYTSLDHSHFGCSGLRRHRLRKKWALAGYPRIGLSKDSSSSAVNKDVLHSRWTSDCELTVRKSVATTSTSHSSNRAQWEREESEAPMIKKELVKDDSLMVGRRLRAPTSTIQKGIFRQLMRTSSSAIFNTN
jgi:hypothetical protein